MKVKPRKSLSNLTGGLKCMCTHTEAEMVFKRRNEYTTNLQSISTWLLCTFMRSIASIHAHFPRQTDWLMAVATYIYTWQPLWSVAQGLKFKEGGMSSSPQTREKALSLLAEASSTQISSRPRNRGDYCDSARIPSAPHSSRVQLHSEHTLLRQTPEFQRHFIERLKLLTSTTKYCHGISRLSCGH